MGDTCSVEKARARSSDNQDDREVRYLAVPLVYEAMLVQGATNRLSKPCNGREKCGRRFSLAIYPVQDKNKLLSSVQEDL